MSSDRSSAYRRRIIDAELDELLAGLPAVALEGAKGVGKTATATRRAKTIRALDDPRQVAVAAGDLAVLLEGEQPVLLDEWQRVPALWDRVRRAVDDGAPAGAFLLAGSASPSDPGTHSGAGRIVSVRLRPMSLLERQAIETPTVSLADLLHGERSAVHGETDLSLRWYVEEIVQSGFPAMRDLRGRVLRTQLDGYLARIVDRDFPELGHQVRNPGALRRWMTAYAAASSSSMSFEKIRDAATGGEGDKPAKTTILPYRDVLERLWILDPVDAWLPTRNRVARLSSPPKHQLVDPALAARLLGVDADALLAGATPGPAVPRDGALLGALFESLVTQSVRVYAQANEARVGHLRSSGGTHEVDLIVERGDGRVLAIEVKLTQSPDDRDVRHLHWLAGQIGDDLLDRVIVTSGRFAYRRPDGIAVVPAALLGP